MVLPHCTSWRICSVVPVVASCGGRHQAHPGLQAQSESVLHEVPPPRVHVRATHNLLLSTAAFDHGRTGLPEDLEVEVEDERPVRHVAQASPPAAKEIRR